AEFGTRVAGSAMQARTEDVEISIQAVEELRPNEEENDQQRNARMILKREFTQEEIIIARFADLNGLDEFTAKGDAHRQQWMLLYFLSFGLAKPDRKGRSRVLLALAAIKKWKVKFFDISKAFLHAPIREKVFLEPPAEHRRYCSENFGADPGDVVWRLNCAIYRLNETTVDFDAHYSQTNFEKLNMRRLASEPRVYVSKDAMTIVARHVDDGMVIGEGNGPDEF
ncbi:unnamed protein product, partial [Prorocentrum cordatum]